VIEDAGLFSQRGPRYKPDHFVYLPVLSYGSRENVTILNLSAERIARYLAGNVDENTCILIDCGDGSYITSGPKADGLLQQESFMRELRAGYDASGSRVLPGRILSSAPIVAPGWHITTVYDTSKGNGMAGFIQLLVFLLLALFVVLAGVVYVVVGMITKPLHKLTGMMAEVTGDEGYTARFLPATPMISAFWPRATTA
jgi:hypothetical protein